MYINGGTANITDGNIGGTGGNSGNNARQANGGGLALEGEPQTVNVTDVTIGGANLTQSNGAQEGGGVFLGDGTNTITGGTVDFNQAFANDTSRLRR